MRTLRRLDTTVCGLVIVGLAATKSGAAAQFNHVRSDDATTRSVLADGYQRSATVRKLVDDIEQSPGIVYVAGAVKLSQNMEGALLHTVSGTQALPILRIAIKTNLSRDRAIAITAHELQHAREALHAGVHDPGTMAAFFRSLDGESTTGKFETEEARAITSRVLAELRITRR